MGDDWHGPWNYPRNCSMKWGKFIHLILEEPLPTTPLFSTLCEKPSEMDYTAQVLRARKVILGRITSARG